MGRTRCAAPTVQRASRMYNCNTQLRPMKTALLIIDVQNADLRLRPGMTANVTVTFQEVDAPRTVPNAALRYRPPVPPGGPRDAQTADATSGRKTVYVLRGEPGYEVLATHPMGEVVMATPAISDGLLVIRTLGHVVGIAEKNVAEK